MAGRDGNRLSDYWSSGMRSMHGIHVHGFPNAFLVQLGQGGNFLANVPHNLTDAAETVAAVISHTTSNGYDAEPRITHLRCGQIGGAGRPPGAFRRPCLSDMVPGWHTHQRG